MIITHKVNANLLGAINELSKKRLAVGWGKNQKYPDGTPVAEVAAVQEFGSPADKIPPRPFMRPSIAEYQDKWVKSLVFTANKVFQKDMSVAVGYRLMGDVVSGDIRKTISQIWSPKLAKRTIQARKAKLADGGKAATAGIEKPLIDTGLMLSSLTSEIQ